MTAPFAEDLYEIAKIPGGFYGWTSPTGRVTTVQYVTMPASSLGRAAMAAYDTSEDPDMEFIVRDADDRPHYVVHKDGAHLGRFRMTVMDVQRRVLMVGDGLPRDPFPRVELTGPMGHRMGSLMPGQRHGEVVDQQQRVVALLGTRPAKRRFGDDTLCVSFAPLAPLFTRAVLVAAVMCQITRTSYDMTVLRLTTFPG